MCVIIVFSSVLLYMYFNFLVNNFSVFILIFKTKTLYAFLDCSIRATCPAHLSRLNLRFLIMLGVGQVAQAARRLAAGLDGPGSIPGVGGGDFSSHLRVQTGPGVHSTSYKMSTGEFPRG